MIADVVYDDQVALLGRAPQSATKLLHPDYRRLGWAQHQHSIDRRNVNAFVKHVDGKNDVQLTGLQALKRANSWRRCLTRVNRSGSQPSRREECGHEIRVSARTAETNRTATSMEFAHSRLHLAHRSNGMAQEVRPQFLRRRRNEKRGFPDTRQASHRHPFSRALL